MPGCNPGRSDPRYPASQHRPGRPNPGLVGGLLSGPDDSSGRDRPRSRNRPPGSGRRGRRPTSFVCPDNGLLTPILDRYPKAKVRRAINRDIFRKQVSPTFHGRDVFAPTAGFLAASGAVGEIGPLINDPIRLDLAQPRIKNGQIRGRIIHIDRFGNLISNIPAEIVLNSPRTGAPRFELAGQSLNGLHLTYAEAEPGEPLMLVGGFDLVEAAVNQGRADQFFDSRIGDEIIAYL